MSRIHISRDRQTLGQFGPEEVAVGLKSGRFLPTDLAWRDGMESWQPLSTFTDLPEISAPEPEETPLIAPGAEILESPGTTPPSPPWEEDKPVLTRLLETIQKVLLAPGEAFANVPADSQVLRAMGFMILAAWPSFIVYLGYQLVFDAMGAGADNPEALQVDSMVLIAFCAVFAVLAPLMFVVHSFISAAIFHGILMMFGGANRSFWTTYRVVAYVIGTTSVFLIVPLCGGFVLIIWAPIALAVGLKTAHQTTWVNAIVTTLLPTVICCGLFIAVVSVGYYQLMQQ